MSKIFRFLLVVLAIALLAGAFTGAAVFAIPRLEMVDRWMRNVVQQQATEEALLVMYALDTRLETFQQDDLTPLQERVRQLAGDTRVIRLVLGIPGSTGENLLLVASEPPIQAGSADEKGVFESIHAQVRDLPPSSSCTGYLPLSAHATQTSSPMEQRLTSIAMQESSAGCWRILVGWREGSATRRTMDTSFWNMPQLREIMLAYGAVGAVALFPLLVVSILMVRLSRAPRIVYVPQQQSIDTLRSNDAGVSSSTPSVPPLADIPPPVDAPLPSAVASPADVPPPVNRETPSAAAHYYSAHANLHQREISQLAGELEGFLNSAISQLPDISETGRARLSGLVNSAQQIRHYVEVETPTGDSDPATAQPPPPPPPPAIVVTAPPPPQNKAEEDARRTHAMTFAPAPIPPHTPKQDENLPSISLKRQGNPLPAD